MVYRLWRLAYCINMIWTLPKLQGPGLRIWHSASFICHCMINKIQGQKNFVEGNMEADGKAEERLVCFILEHLAVMIRDIREDNQGPHPPCLFGKLQMENVLHCKSDGSGHTEVGTLSIELDISKKQVLSKKKVPHANRLMDSAADLVLNSPIQKSLQRYFVRSLVALFRKDLVFEWKESGVMPELMPEEIREAIQ